MPLPDTIPGPPPAFLLGWRGNAWRYVRDVLGYAIRLHLTYGHVAGLSRGGNAHLGSRSRDCPGTVFAFGPAHNQAILSDTAAFHEDTRTGLQGTPVERLEAGIFNMNGEKHRQQRRLMLPAFQKKRVEAYRDDMVSLTRRALDGWAPGAPRDGARAMARPALCIAPQALCHLHLTSD